MKIRIAFALFLSNFLKYNESFKCKSSKTVTIYNQNSFFRENGQYRKLNLHARTKKKTNSKRALDMDDEDDNIDEEIKNSDDIEQAIKLARNKLNLLKMNINKVKIEDDNMISSEKSSQLLVPKDSDSWKEAVRNIIQNVISTKIFTTSTVVNEDIINDNSSSELSKTDIPLVQNITPISILPQTPLKITLMKLSIIADRIEIIVSNGT